MHQPRPATVTVAFALQATVAGLLLLLLATTIVEYFQYDGLIDRAAQATSPDPGEVSDERLGNLVGSLVFGLCVLAPAVWLGITALWLRRGSNVARILALIGLGLPLLAMLGGCLLGGLLVFAFAGAMLAPVDASDPAFTDEPPWTSSFYDKLDDLDTSGWPAVLGGVDAIATLLVAALAITTFVLLLVSPSNRFFRPPPRAFWYPIYLPYPAYPPVRPPGT